MSVTVSCGSRISGATAGIRPRTRRVRNPLASILHGLLAVVLMLFLCSRQSRGTESNSPPPSLSTVEATNLQSVLRTCVQIQEQLQRTQLAVEESRQEAKRAATQSAEALVKGLQVLQEALLAERTQEVEARQRSNKTMLTVAGTFAGVGLLALLFLTCLQWRTSNRLADISAALPVNRGLSLGADLAALSAGGRRLVLGGAAAQSSSRLLSALDQLDKRIHELRQEVSAGGNGDPAEPADGSSAPTDPDPSQVNEHARIPALLNKAYSMMSLENPESAVACFDEVLALDPNHAEALVKKGAALERLHRLNEAIECYDRAIAADSSLTTAYLHKGGLYNRLERFKEALQCYENALRTHDQRPS